MDIYFWWSNLPGVWKNIFQSELDINGSPSPLDFEMLTKLIRVDCSRKTITSLEPLTQLTGLKIIDCSNTDIKYLDRLVGLPELEILNCSKTKITSLLSVGKMQNLRKLNCSATKIQSLDGLQDLEFLEDLDCSATDINSLEPIRNINSLTALNISKTRINSIDPIMRLIKDNPEKLLMNNCPARLEFNHFFENESGGKVVNLSNRDKYFEDCARIVVQTQSGSTSNLQKRFNLGYNRTERIVDQLESSGIVGPARGSKLRKVYFKNEMELEEFLQSLD